MSVSSVTVIGVSADYPEAGVRKYTLTYGVQCDDHLDGPYTALNAAGIPTWGDTWAWGNDADPYAGLASKRPIKRERSTAPSGVYYEIECQFSTATLNETAKAENPLDDPSEYSMTFVEITRYREKDLDGNPVENRAHDPFIGGIEIPVYMPLLHVRRNEQLFGDILEAAKQYVGKVNSDAFHPSIDVGEALMRNIEVSAQRTRNGIAYHSVSYEVLIADVDDFEEMHQVIKLNEGIRINNGTKLVQLKDVEGVKITEPVALAADGLSALDTTGTPNYIDFKIHNSVAFAPLQLF